MNTPDLKTIIYMREDVMLVFRRYIYAQTHKHHAIQVTIALEGMFQAVLDDQPGRYQALMINHDYPHQVIGQEAWVASFLLNPETPMATTLQTQLLQGKPYHSFAINPTLQTALGHVLYTRELEAPCQQLDNLFDSLVQHLQEQHTLEQAEIDTRIAEALDIIQDVPEKKISAVSLAKEVALSEGRFGHLFKEEIGLPLRRYLLWQRLLTAIQSILEGHNFTAAAHEAGFTDSAHLSRTFRQMFGIRLSDMFANREALTAVICHLV